MLSDSDGERELATVYRPDAGVEDALMDDRTVATVSNAGEAASMPQMFVSQCEKVYVGPRYISVTQKVKTTEEIKEPLPRYLWKVLKNTSRAERLSCVIALAVLFLCIGLTLYFVLTAPSANTDNEPDIPSHEWNITREMWLAKNYNDSEPTTFSPSKLVIVQHTVSPECNSFPMCVNQMRILQDNFLKSIEDDIPYNFLIGNDGRVYEGRGWGLVGAHTLTFNRCSVGIGFLGDYREELYQHTVVTDAQINRTKMLLEDGVKKGYLDPNYYIVGACDLRSTASPGSHLYKVLKTFDHFDRKGIIANKTSCEEIYEAIEKETKHASFIKT